MSVGEVTPLTMPRIEVTLPDDVEVQIDQMVDEGKFVNRDEAIEELLSLGIKEHQTVAGEEERGEVGFEEEMMATDERSLGDDDDGYAF